MQWTLFVGAFALAAFLLMFYVQLVQGAVERGSQWRYAQLRPTAAGGTVQRVESSSTGEIR